MSPTNNSTAKAQYSFSKATRFPAVSPTSSNFYDIPPSFSKRTTTFGYGQKYDFTSEKEKTPDPGEYKVSADIASTGKAFSFGISRDASKRYFEGHFVADPSTPGPGAYPFQPKFGREGRVITIGGKRTEVKVTSLSPGPGAYEQKWETSKGQYVLSTLKSQGVNKFPPPSSPRFPKSSNSKAPAPGSYEVDKGFMRNAQILSTVKFNGSRKFPMSSREFMRNSNESPGPGAYRLPSEFGYYESSKNDPSKSTPNLPR